MNAKTAKRVGYDPAIGATIDDNPSPIAKLKLNSAVPVNKTTKSNGRKAFL